MAALPAGEGLHVRIWVAEFVATALLLLVGLSVVCLVSAVGSPISGALPSHSLRLLVTGSSFPPATASSRSLPSAAFPAPTSIRQ